MAYRDNVYEKAAQRIKERRARAERKVEERRREVAEKHPELLMIEREMSQAGLAAMKAMGMGANRVSYLEKLKNKSLAVQAERIELLKHAGYPEDYLEHHYECEQCKDRGFVEGVTCSCYKKLIKDIAYEELNLFSPLDLSSFESFDLNFYPDTKDAHTGLNIRNQMRDILNYCKGYAEDFDESSPSVLMYGATGLGKTHLSLAIAREAINKGYDVIYGSTQNLLNKLERERFGRSNEESGKTEQLLVECDLLILDDLGAEFSTQFTVAAFYNIINTRMLSTKPTIISTNLMLDEIEGKYTQRITSRIIGSYTPLLFLGKDIRMIKSMNC